MVPTVNIINAKSMLPSKIWSYVNGPDNGVEQVIYGEEKILLLFV